MKGMFKRALAGVAAAAIAVTGLALGAGAATAAAADPSIVITGATEGSTYTAYRIASYKSAQAVDTDGNQVLDAVTNVDMDTDPTNSSFVFQAIKNANIGSVDAPYTNNPAAWLALQGDEALRKFADEFRKLIDDEDEPAVDPVSSGNPATVAEGATSTTVSPNTEGWYVVTDSQGRAMVVSTGITVKGDTSDDGVTYTTLVKLDDEGKVESTQPLGTVVAKPTGTPIPEKVPENFTAVGVGDSKKFTITVDVPTLSGYTEYKGFTVTDTASKGLQMPDPGDYVVKIGGASLTYSTDYTIEQNGDSTSQTVTTVTFTDLVATLKNHKLTDDGSLKIMIEYTAEITADADDDSVSNQVSVTDPYSSTPGTPVPGETVEIPVGRIEFTKTGVDDPTGLQGATFNVKNSEDKTLLFTYDAEGGYYMYAGPDAEATDIVKTDVVSDANGKVVLKGLPVDEYTIEETATNTDKGYSNNFLPTFTVSVNAIGSHGNATETTSFGLVDSNDGVITVSNVKSLAQLPVTGAAGTALFTVLGLLIAGAGALVYMKSRNVKHALRG